MSYLVLARKYRPQTFADLVGQEAIASTLKRAVERDRVAHAILLTGSRGVGKTSMARILAKALNCRQGPTPEPCNECDICQSITRGNDLDVIEIDGASNNRVDEIRELRDNVSIVSSRSRFKIYIIDEIHMLSISAFNALLKTLEEPPQHVKFVFATTNPQKLPDTIHSRCQRFDFRPIPEEDLGRALAGICDREGIEYDAGGIAAVARVGRGSMRDSLTTLDRVAVSCDGKLTAEAVEEALGLVAGDTLLELLDSLAAGEGRRVLEVVDRVHGAGRDLSALLSRLVDELRALMLAVVYGDEDPPGDRSTEERARLRERAGAWPLDRILYALQVLADAQFRLRGSEHPRVVVEASLLMLARADEWVSVPELLAALEDPSRAPAGGPAGAGRGPGPRPGPSGRRRPGAGDSRAAVEESPAAGPTPSDTPRPSPGPPPDEGPVRVPGGPETVPGEPAGGSGAAASDRPGDADASVELTLDSVRERFDRLLETVRRSGRPSISAFLAGGEVAAVEGRAVTLTFPATKRFVARQFEFPDTRKILDSSTEEVFGVRLTLVPRFVATEGEAGEAEEPSRSSRPTDPSVKQVLDLFDGRIVGRED